jgi:vitamin B12 transporter
MKKNFFVVAAVIISSISTAQDSTTAKQLDEVIVTANRTSQKQSTTGKVVTVISKTQIEKASGRTLGQLLNDQAGVTINGSLNTIGSNQTVYMRGAAVGRTLILLDGIPVYDPSFINSEFDLNLISLNDIERIEVCRGAQSTLYGSDAVAGVINIITVKKDIDKAINLKTTLSGGSFNTFRGNAQVYGKIGKLTYTSRYARLQTDGFSAANDSSGNKNFDRDDYRGNVFNLSLLYQAAPAIGVKAFVQQSRYNNGLDASIFSDERDYRVKNKNTVAGAGFRYQKNNVSITGNYQYSDIYRNYRNDSGHAPGFTKFSTDDYYGKTQFVEIFASTRIEHGITLLQGADYRYSSMNSKLFSLSSFGPFSSQFSDTVHSQASLYFSAIYNSFNEKLNIELGGRMNVHSRYGSNSTFTFNPSFSFNKNFRVFGSIATAFKAPSLYQLYSAFGNPDLKPEYSTNYELGFQQQHEKVRTRIVYFHRVIKDGLDFDNVKFQYFNFNKQTVNGLEIEGNVEAIKGLNLSFNYTYLHPDEQSQSRVSFKDTSYSYLLRRPAHSLNINAGYQLTKKLLLSLSGKYVSDRYDFGGYQKADVNLDSYLILNAYAEYKFGKNIKLFVDVQNLTDKKFFDVWGYNSMPFMMNGGVTVNW